MQAAGVVENGRQVYTVRVPSPAGKQPIKHLSLLTPLKQRINTSACPSLLVELTPLNNLLTHIFGRPFSAEHTSYCMVAPLLLTPLNNLLY